MEHHQTETSIAFLSQATSDSLASLVRGDQLQSDKTSIPVGQPTRWSTRQKLLLAGCVILALALAITVPLLASSPSSSTSSNAAARGSSNSQDCSSTEGTFAVASACQPWSSCQQGDRMIKQGTATSDRVCQSCVYQDSTSSEPTPCRVCNAGTYLSALHTATSDRVCTPCPDGTYQDAVVHLHVSCKDKAICRGGQYAVEGNMTHGRLCLPCPFGTYLATLLIDLRMIT
jgi:hypothetical protein